jgi:hypothetical protein
MLLKIILLNMTEFNKNLVELIIGDIIMGVVLAMVRGIIYPILILDMLKILARYTIIRYRGWTETPMRMLCRVEY